MAEVKKSAAAIRDSLLAQLRAKGAEVSHFSALVEDYIYYYQTEKKLQADVKKNGFTLKATSAQGNPYDKENPAIKAAALYNRQKLALLKEMGLTTENCQALNDDEL